jgi:hypothetical protein
MEEMPTKRPSSGEPWGGRLWLLLSVVVLVAACLQSYGISSWPMADDEVPSLVEMGLIQVPAQAFSVPASQIGRLPRAVPVWYAFQRFAIDALQKAGLPPNSQVLYRLTSVVFGVLSSALVFVVAARWRGLAFAIALAMVMNMSQLFIFLSQLDRFYSLPFLLMTVTLALMWIPSRRVWALPVIAVLSVLTVLSHNVTLAVFGLAFGASVALFVLGRGRIELVLRSGVALVVAFAVYVFYLLPLVRGWNSTGNPTPVLVSYVAYVSVPVLALTVVGMAIAVARREAEVWIWWGTMFLGGVCLLQFTHMTWSPRYFLFFLPAAWVLAAYAIDAVAGRLEARLAVAAWYACCALLMAPSLLSHFVDGSRHDYRQAADVLIDNDYSGLPILSDDAETISYYLPSTLRQNLFVRTKVTQLPSSEFFLVARANVWMSQPTVRGRDMDLLGEISKRRFDQFSHVLRVYRVRAPATR